ncbi:putative esterase/lipase [Escherichia coli]|uniref:Putative esterase/lipase n=1 Tax=Escherichia coli TaxID=562 RepID=A0A485JLE2_ECOLX|nr:putative esterase/lipase [Escherichia coli]
MNYPAMAQDLVDTLDALQIDKATFIGHSMGGKAVMALTALTPDRIDKLVAIDIAPVNYHVRRHDEIFAAINAVSESDAQTRQQAAAIMRQHLNEEGVIQFLLKSFVDGSGALTCRYCGISIRILWVGRKSRHGITLPCLSLAAILRMLASSTAMIYWHNFHRHGRM